MTASDACTLLIDTTKKLSAARADCESWRFLALAACERATELARELEVIDQRQYIHRTRTQDERDVFIDQRDLRQEAA